MRIRCHRSPGVHPALVDLPFVLAFMFLILSTLADTTMRSGREDSLPPIDLPELEGDDSGNAVGSNSRTVSISPGPIYQIDQEPAVSLRELEAHLIRTRPVSLEIRADVSVNYGDVAEVLRICHTNEIESVILSYRPI